jgi:hypothetical protein
MKCGFVHHLIDADEKKGKETKHKNNIGKGN